MRHSFLAILPAFLLACSGAPDDAAAQPGVTPSSNKPFVETVMADLDSPWAMTFLPDGRFLVTEKDGRLLLFAADGRSHRPVTGAPPVDSAGQGGLMDVVLHPGFASNHIVYLSASQSGAGGKGVVLFRGRFVEDRGAPRLQGLKAIFRATPFVDGDGHYSGRIAFSPDGRYLFFTNGERQQFTPAQNPAMTLGKVLRLLPDGAPAPCNPLAARGFHPAIWSYGHRNLYGLAFDAQGNLWEHEMGPMGGDEVNLIQPGQNYGWPNASNGSNYDGTDIPDHRRGDGNMPPKVWWNPSISPAGMIVYSGAMFPQWQGDILMGGLSGQALIRIQVNGTAAHKAQQWDMTARIREVEQGPDGAVWLLEDGGSQGRVIKLTAKCR